MFDKKLAGMAHVDTAVVALEQFAKYRQSTLTIISDRRWQYLLGRRKWALPTFYQPFAPDSFQAALARHDVAIIPVVKNPYTIGKSINRPATAVLAGLGVVADPLDSYLELRPFIELGDWQVGLSRYSKGKDARNSEARRYLESRYSLNAVGQHWLRLVEYIGRQRAAQ